MKNSVLSAVALILAAAAMAVSLLVFLQPEAETPDYSAEITALQGENARLQEQIDGLNGQLSAIIRENSYCNLMIEEWKVSDGALIISVAFAQAQIPGGGIQGAELVLYCNGELCASAPVTLEEGDGTGSYECTVTDISLAMPALGEDDCVDLYLQITLADGSVIRAPGGSWYAGGEGLFAIMG